MKRKWVWWCCLLVFGVHFMTWVSATSRFLGPNHDHSHLTQDNGSGTDPFHVKTTSIEVNKIKKGIEKSDEKHKESSYEDEKKIGSRPPSCENKCYGCSPCEAIQVPTITAAFTIQYANYFPEGWKCKCGPSFYSP